MILADWLKQNGIRRRDFAARIRVTPGMIGDYCSGKSWPGRDVMKRIAAETGGDVTANDFVEMEAAQ